MMSRAFNDPGESTANPGVNIITQSSSLRRLVKTASRIATSSAAVLITGQSGTGKELFSRLIHNSSGRKSSPFVAVNCAALSDNLIESELFGHEQGAFTDAVCQRIGRFEAASGGSLLLDEVTEIPLNTQAKLLRAIEESEISRIGSNVVIPTDVRIIATSNRDLEAEVQSGRFRLDLFHRLNVIQIKVPALNERPEDIPLLANYFLQKFKTECSIKVRGFCVAAINHLVAYHWPGNVRELRNVVHRACVMATKPMIDIDCLPDFSKDEPEVCENLPDSLVDLPLSEIERLVIFAALRKHRSKKNAAEALGVTPRTLSNKLKLYQQQNLARFVDDVVNKRAKAA